VESGKWKVERKTKKGQTFLCPFLTKDITACSKRLKAKEKAKIIARHLSSEGI